jgi:hypothetical protein
MARAKNEFQTIHSEGGLLPPDLLRRVVDPKANLSGTKPEDYGLPQGERLNEAITQSWNRMRRHWAEFRTAAKNLPEHEPGTGLTNDKWSVPLLRELGFGLLPTSAGPEVNGRTYAINRFFGSTAVHLVGCGLSLDRRAAGVRGAAVTNPHGLVQEFLNRSPVHLWAIVSNGLRFRVLRDNQALSRQSYLEFDLEAMFAGEVFSDFVLLWLMAHATRFAPQGDGPSESCWLEQWTKVADEEGTRALGDLRAGVEKALQILGEAFVSHPRNTALREALRSEQLPLKDFHGQLLRVVYRLIFLFVAEDRTLDGIPLIHPRDESESGRQGRERYGLHYSTSRLRDLAGKIKGSRHGDLWQQFNLLVGALSGDDRFSAVRQNLALPALGSFLWNPNSTSALNAASLHSGAGVELANADFLESLRNLAYTRQGKVLRPVDYKNLGAEELGGVYETLLALTPQISGDGNRFTFAEFAGNERKTSGSYYTPDSLVQCLLDSALDPVVEEALKGKSGAEAEKAILSLKICDPAVGSGHFLVGAAHRLARHLSRVRANTHGESEPSPLLYQHALRDVIGRCLYGVDINPMSAELCRVGLWLEALEPGKPLSFLDHHIQVGNSLLGTTPALLAAGIPDDAFAAIEGDVKAKCAELKRDNKRERNEFKSGQGYLFDPPFKMGNLAAEFVKIDDTPDDSAENILEKERRYAELVKGQAYQSGRLLADAWCAAFVWKKDNSDLGNLCPTERTFRKVESHAVAGLLPLVRAEVERLRDQYQFFHWHLAFPDVFRLPGTNEELDNRQMGCCGGFDVVLGNPPWEHVELKEEEFFARREPSIAAAANAAARKKAIIALKDTNPSLLNEYETAARHVDGERHLLASTGRFPLCARGRINTYAVFAESMRNALSPSGRLGVIVPTGIATDDTTRFYFGDLVNTRTLASLLSFENEEFIFPGVHHSYCFCLMIVSGIATPQEHMEFVFFARRIQQLSPDAGRRFVLTPEDIILLNPNTLTCPVFRSEQDASITKSIFRRVPVFIRDRQQDGDLNPWHVSFSQGLFNMASDSGLFVDPAQACSAVAEVLDRDRNASPPFLPLYEAKLFHQFDHRWATYALEGSTWLDTPIRHKKSKDGRDEPDSRDIQPDEHANPNGRVTPRYWLSTSTFEETLVDTDKNGNVTWRWDREWLLSWRDISRANNDRTCIATILPRVPVGHTVPLMFPEGVDAKQAACLIACFNSFIVDYIARQKVSGTHLTYGFVKQFPILPPAVFVEPCPWDSLTSRADWIAERVLELVYTNHELAGFANDLGYVGAPFRWDTARRANLRAELDGAYFHLYGICREDVAYIMDTFIVFKTRDEGCNGGDYLTKRVILDVFDAMQEAIRTGRQYHTRLDPPPADPSIAHPPRRHA